MVEAVHLCSYIIFKVISWLEKAHYGKDFGLRKVMVPAAAAERAPII